jgi:thioredoxin reductase
MSENYDVVVVGGGAAGLAGAVALARSRRSVLVVDSGEPRNAPASHVHNFLTRDGTPPAQIYAAGREEVARYGGTVVTGRVTALSRDGERFRVQLGDRAVSARRLLMATGLRDELPEIPGLAARWGIDVLHCPYCHGWEVRDQRIGILATGPPAAHQALLFRQLSPHVTVLRHSGPELTDDQREQFAALGIAVIDGPVTSVEAGDSGLTGVRLADGSSVPLDALIVAPRMIANAELLLPLGLVPAEIRIDGQVVGTQVEADPSGATSVPGVWVAGNLAGIQAQVITSAAAGLMAGAAINADLAAEDAKAAVKATKTRAARLGRGHKRGIGSPEVLVR